MEAYIPLGIKLAPNDENAFLNSRISGEVIPPDFKLMPSLDEHPQWECLNALNKKIDSVIQMMTSPYDEFPRLSFKWVSISGNGMRFSHKNAFMLGDIIEFKMILKIYKPTVIYVYGEVIQVEKQTDGHFITAQFIKIDDNIRDLIVRFVFGMERGILREQNKSSFNPI